MTETIMSIFKSLLTVSFGFMLMVWMVNTETFKTVTVDLGFQHYAEPTVEYGTIRIMPLNSLVNIAYVIVGVYWLIFAYCKKSLPNSSDGQMLSVAAFMGILYGPVQLWRVVFQTRPSAVLDQWCTTPFFMWVLVWAMSIDSHISAKQYIPLMVLSVCCYFLCVFFTYGFEFILGVHILAVVFYAVRLQVRHGDTKTKSAFVKAFLCCVGFVVLKVFDFHLGAGCVLLQRFSGHFWSKVCDALQLHYVCVFLTEMTFLKSKESRQKVK